MTPTAPPSPDAPLAFHGYQCEGTWDGQRLVVRGTNKLAHVALAGAKAKEGDLLIPCTTIEGVTTKPAKLLTNGVVKVAVNGLPVAVQLHFLKKHQDVMLALADELQRWVAINEEEGVDDIEDKGAFEDGDED